MTATEARSKMRKARAIENVKRIFPVIEAAVKAGKGGIKLNIQWMVDTTSKTSLTEEEFEVLRTEYGYELQALYDDSGDYHKSDKKYAYNVLWEK